MKRLASLYDIYTTTKEAWAAMLEAIQKAEKSIYWEVYIFLDDETGNVFFDALMKKAQEGLDVKLIIDSLGSFFVSNKKIEELKTAGVDVRLFQERKRKWRGLSHFFARTHRKILVIDERIGFIGGVNIQKRMENWLDMQVRIEGKVVRSLLRSFAKMYVICGGSKKEVRHLLRYRFRLENEKYVNFIYDDAYNNRSHVRETYEEALLKARERVILFSPYYFPDREFLKALWHARQRGVRVDLLIPFRTDLRIVTYAAYFWFALMKKYGVRIHLLNKMMHGKGVIVDDEWAMIGSSNLDHTSFYDCYEANVQIYDKEFVKRVKKPIEEWMKISTPLEKLDWEHRGYWQRFKEWISYRLYILWHKRGKRSWYEQKDTLQDKSTGRSDETKNS